NEYGSKSDFGTIIDRIGLLLTLNRPIWAENNIALLYLSHLLGVFILLVIFVSAIGSKPSIFIANRAIGPLCALATFMFLMPAGLNGVWFVNIRYPFVLVMLLIASSEWRGLGFRTSAILTGAFLVLFIGRLALMHQEFATYAKDTGDLVALANDVPPAARIMPIRGSAIGQAPLDWHRQAYLTIYGDAFVPTLFLGSQALKIKEPWRKHADSQGRSISADLIFGDRMRMVRTFSGHEHYSVNWQQKFTHLLAIDQDAVPADAGNALTRISSSGRYTLYKINQAGTDAVGELGEITPSPDTDEQIRSSQPD
ncbi:MAG: hypothetical protein AAF556_08935, partial [Pseudomonadota bacterium]